MQKMETGDLRTISQLDWLRELEKRQALDEEASEALRRLEAGREGEQFVLDALEAFGAPHWTVVPNVWLKSQGAFECDLVVMTYAGIYTFEIKHYSGHFEFQNMQCRLNGEKIGFNAIIQAQRSYIQLENLVRTAMPRVNVYGALVFVGEHNTVAVYDEVSDIRIVMRNELRNFIWEMRKQERNHQGSKVNTHACLQLLERHKTPDPFLPEPLSGEIKNRMQGGICCSHCGQFNLDAAKSYFVCSCGMHEPRENAIVRTICEYGVIHFDKDLVTSEVADFFDGDVSRSTLLNTLKKHFKMIGNNRSAAFRNPAVPFAKLYPFFTFSKSRMLHIDHY